MDKVIYIIRPRNEEIFYSLCRTYQLERYFRRKNSIGGKRGVPNVNMKEIADELKVSFESYRGIMQQASRAVRLLVLQKKDVIHNELYEAA